MSLGDLLNNIIVQVVLALIAMIEFTVSIISYFKISKVRKSQIKYRDIIELNTIIENLNRNTEILRGIRNDSNIRIPEYMTTDIDQLVTDNLLCIGAVNKANEIILNSDKFVQKGTKEAVVYHEKGYFDKHFFDNIILGAKQRIVLYLKRNVRPFTLDNLSALINLAERNVEIDIFCFSPQIDATLLEEMKKTIPSCPSTDELKHSQEANRQTYMERKAKMKNPGNFNYYEYLSYPLSQYILVDNTLYWGIVNYDKTSMTDPFRDRPYLEMDASTDFAKYIMSCNKAIKESCQANKSNY